MGQLTDASVVLRLGYQAIRRAGLPTEELLTKAGVALNQVEANDRTPLSAQYAFWVAAEEVSKDFEGFQAAKYMLNSDSSFIDFLIIDFQFRIQFTVSFGF